MQGQLSLLCPLFKSEDQQGLLVSFPKGVGPTKVRAQCAYIFRLVSFVCNHRRGGGVVARKKLCHAA